MEYQDLIKMVNRYDEEYAERWNIAAINDHFCSKENYRMGKIYVLT